MWDVGGDAPRPARLDPARLVADPELEPAGDEDADLLVLVAVLGDDAVRVELDHREGHALALDHAAGDAVPDALGVEGLEIGERAGAAHPGHHRR